MMEPVDIIHNAIVDMKLYHETLTPQDIFNNAKAVIKRLQMAGYDSSRGKDGCKHVHD